MIIHKWPFRWEKEARIAWETPGPEMQYMSDDGEVITAGPKIEPEAPPPQPEVVVATEKSAAEQKLEAAQTALAGTEAGGEIAAAQAKIDAAHAARLADTEHTITSEDEAIYKKTQANLDHLTIEISESGQTLDASTVESLSTAAHVAIVSGRDITETQIHAGEEKDQTEKILATVLEDALHDPDVIKIMANDPGYNQFVHQNKETTGDHILPEAIKKITKEFFKDTKIEEGDLIVLGKDDKGRLKVTIQKADSVDTTNETLMNLEPTLDNADAKTLVSRYHIGINGQGLSLPPGTKIKGADATAYNFPADAVSLSLTGDEYKKTLTLVTKDHDRKETKTTIQLPDKPIDPPGKLPEGTKIQISFEGDQKNATDALTTNNIKFLDEKGTGKISVGEPAKKWRLDDQTTDVTISSPDGKQCMIRLVNPDGTQTLTIKDGAVVDNVMVNPDGTVVRKTPGLEPRLRAADATMDGKILTTKKGSIDVTRGGTLTNTRVEARDDGTVIVQGINDQGEITEYKIDLKTEPSAEQRESINSPTVEYDRGARRILEAQEFPGGEIHFETKTTDTNTILTVRTDEIPPGTLLRTATNGAGEDAKRALANFDVSQFTKYKIEKKDGKTLDVTGTKKDGKEEKVSIVFKEKASLQEERKESREEEKHGKVGTPEGPTGKPITDYEKEGAKTPEIAGQVKRVPTFGKMVYTTSESGGDRAEMETKRDLARSTCTAVFGDTFDFNAEPIETQQKILSTIFPLLQTNTFTKDGNMTVQAQFVSEEWKQACVVRLNEVKGEKTETPSEEIPKFDLTQKLTDVPTDTPEKFNTTLVNNINIIKNTLLSWLYNNNEKISKNDNPTEKQIDDAMKKIDETAENLMTVLEANKTKAIEEQKSASKEAASKFATELTKLSELMPTDSGYLGGYDQIGKTLGDTWKIILFDMSA